MASETEMIRHQMEGTRRDMADKIEQLEAKVANTVESVTETVGSVKDTVQNTVEAVEHTLDLKWHADKHPWALMGGAVLVGFLGASLLRPRRRDRETHHWHAPPPPPQQKTPEQSQASSGGILGAIGQEVSELKKYGIGMAMGVMREVVASTLPSMVAPAVSEAVNQLTVKLGGEPLGLSQPDHTTSSQSSHPGEHCSEPGACL